jgi:hypothetical protein
MPTVAAHLRTGKPRITVDHLLPFLLSNPCEDAEELTECQVAHLLSPQPLHPLKVQRLKVQHIELIRQPMRQLPKPIPPSVGDVLMFAAKI